VQSSTAQMVGAVRQRWQADPAATEALFAAIAQSLRKRVVPSKRSPRAAGQLMNENMLTYKSWRQQPRTGPIGDAADQPAQQAPSSPAEGGRQHDRLAASGHAAGIAKPCKKMAPCAPLSPQ